MEILLSALLAHFVGDFIFQSNRIATLKSKSIQGVAYHCLWIWIADILCFFPYGFKVMLLFSCLNTGIHFGIDCIKLKLGKIKYPTIYFFLDQLMHFACIFLLSQVIVGHSSWMTVQVMTHYKCLILWIICTYVATILIKQLFFSFGKMHFATQPFFMPKERGIDILFNSCVLLAFSYENLSMIGLSFLLGGIYYGMHQKVITYNQKLLTIKITFYYLYIACAYGCYQWIG